MQRAGLYFALVQRQAMDHGKEHQHHDGAAVAKADEVIIDKSAALENSTTNLISNKAVPGI